MNELPGPLKEARKKLMKKASELVPFDKAMRQITGKRHTKRAKNNFWKVFRANPSDVFPLDAYAAIKNKTWMQTPRKYKDDWHKMLAEYLSRMSFQRAQAKIRQWKKAGGIPRYAIGELMFWFREVWPRLRSAQARANSRKRGGFLPLKKTRQDARLFREVQAAKKFLE